jgi:hypothetical protein
VEKKVESSEFLSAFNHSLGGGISLLKTIVIITVLGILVLTIPPQFLTGMPPSFFAIRKNSKFMKFSSLFLSPMEKMARNNKHVKLYEKLMKNPEKISEKLASSKKFQKFINSQKVKRFMNNSSISKLLNDPKIKELSEKRDYAGLMKELLGGKGQALMNDPNFMGDDISSIVSEFEDIVLSLTDEVKIKKRGFHGGH